MATLEKLGSEGVDPTDNTAILSKEFVSFIYCIVKCRERRYRRQGVVTVVVFRVLCKRWQYIIQRDSL